MYMIKMSDMYMKTATHNNGILPKCCSYSLPKYSAHHLWDNGYRCLAHIPIKLTEGGKKFLGGHSNVTVLCSPVPHTVWSLELRLSSLLFISDNMYKQRKLLTWFICLFCQQRINFMLLLHDSGFKKKCTIQEMNIEVSCKKCKIEQFHAHLSGNLI